MSFCASFSDHAHVVMLGQLCSCPQPCSCPREHSGLFDPDIAAQWGITDFDWSNGKALWVNDTPMDSESVNLKQVVLVKEANASTRTFVYRNLVKALPWFGTVREKLVDPRFSGWFLPYSRSVRHPSAPPCTAGKCSRLYHDQDQTPSMEADADGRCIEPCDCGPIPCGEYLFDHRNASLREWLLGEYLLGPRALGSPHVDGVFLDDEWVDTPLPNPWWGPPEGFCTADPHGGPSEMYPNCTVDMGLGAADVAAITAAWKDTDAAARTAAQRAGKWVWQDFVPMSAPPRDPALLKQLWHLIGAALVKREEANAQAG